MIAQMVAEIEAARLLVYQAAWAKDQGNLNNGRDVAMAKSFAGEVANKMRQLCNPYFWFLRIFSRVPDSPPLQRYAYLFHGRRIDKYL